MLSKLPPQSSDEYKLNGEGMLTPRQKALFARELLRTFASSLLVGIGGYLFGQNTLREGGDVGYFVFLFAGLFSLYFFREFLKIFRARLSKIRHAEGVVGQRINQVAGKGARSYLLTLGEKSFEVSREQYVDANSGDEVVIHYLGDSTFLFIDILKRNN